jgi:hypothetical protein
MFLDGLRLLDAAGTMPAADMRGLFVAPLIPQGFDL